MPSRSFAIQRAVLNAGKEEMGNGPDWLVPQWIAGRTINGGWVPPDFHRLILSWYRDYVKEYGHPEPDVTAYDGHSQRI